MRLVSNAKCKAMGKNDPSYKAIGPMHVCAKGAFIKTSDCYGDSGGPLFCHPKAQPSKKVQTGVVSFGIACGQTGVPSVYARVSYALDWIRDNMH